MPSTTTVTGVAGVDDWEGSQGCCRTATGGAGAYTYLSVATLAACKDACLANGSCKAIEYLGVQGPTPAGSDDYRKNPNVGGWGGQCTCPSGKTYWVGDNFDSCGSLACIGGTRGPCEKVLLAGTPEKEQGRGMQVTCTPPVGATGGGLHCELHTVDVPLRALDVGFCGLTSCFTVVRERDAAAVVPAVVETPPVALAATGAAQTNVPVDHPAAATSFKKIGRCCRLAKSGAADINAPPTIATALSLGACQTQCTQHTGCQAVEYRKQSNTCEIHVQPTKGGGTCKGECYASIRAAATTAERAAAANAQLAEHDSAQHQVVGAAHSRTAVSSVVLLSAVVVALTAAVIGLAIGTRARAGRQWGTGQATAAPAASVAVGTYMAADYSTACARETMHQPVPHGQPSIGVSLDTWHGYTVEPLHHIVVDVLQSSKSKSNSSGAAVDVVRLVVGWHAHASATGTKTLV